MSFVSTFSVSVVPKGRQALFFRRSGAAPLLSHDPARALVQLQMSDAPRWFDLVTGVSACGQWQVKPDALAALRDHLRGRRA